MQPQTVSISDDSATRRCSLECAVTSHATSRFSFNEVNDLRKNSQALPGKIANAVLKHCDEQTLAVLAAVQSAIQAMEQPDINYDNWGIVVSSRYLGRSAFAQSLGKFAVEGPWNVSVQVVPHRSLHSPASMLGLTLGCHGPCIGVGGGLDGETDAWLTGVSLLEQHALSGLWLVFCGWEPEVEIDLEGTWLDETRCTALAMALQPASTSQNTLQLRIVRDSGAPEQIEIPAKDTAISLFERFVAAGNQHGPMNAMLGGGLRAEIDWSAPLSMRLPNTPSHKKAA